MKILTFSTLYPNPVQPLYGLFVEQRLANLVANGEISAKVIAPVPWFPSKSPYFGKYSIFPRVPEFDRRLGIDIFHPRHLVIPKVGMSIAPYLMARGVQKTIHKICQSGFNLDLIDAHYFYPDGVAAARLGRFMNRPVVITARGSDVNLIAHYAKPRRQMLRAAANSVAVITVSQALRKRLIELGVSSEKIIVLRNGVDLDVFRPLDRNETRLKLAVKGPLLLSVGTLNENKGHHLWIEALTKFHEVSLLVAGEGDRRRDLERLAAKCGVDSRVCFLGGVDRNQLIRYYSAADVLVLASESEGMPNVVLESLACGTPVVATSVGGIPEIINAPEAGVLAMERSVPMLIAALSGLLAAPPDREATRRYAKQFSWKNTAQGQLSLFRKICQKNVVSRVNASQRK